MKFALVFIVPFSLSIFASSLTELTPKEILETTKRIDNFFSLPLKSGAMDVQGTKTDPETGLPLNLHTELFDEIKSNESPLLFQAQIKASRKYQSWYCRTVLKKISPNFPCEEKRVWGDFQRDDRVSDLTDSWVKEVSYSPDDIPVKGESDRPLWSDDYWAMQHGLTSYRYSEANWFEDYRTAIDSYLQPQAWIAIENLSLEKINSEIVKWSPSEKYDLSIQDIEFSLTNEQKKEGEGYQNGEGEVEGWMGLCHGWAPASIMVPRPSKPVEWGGPKGTTVLWYPNDIKAMITLAWANGDWESNFVGRRCEQKNVKTLPNGRINSQDCFDNNPATFHLALGNMIGKEKASFVMDKAYDYQVWNQPIVGYEFEYFNPLKPEKKSKEWSEVAVKYNQNFKRKDRFQQPLTRGKFREGADRMRNIRTEPQDAHIEKVVGVIATVVYLVETVPPDFGPRPSRDNYGRDIYLYDLEIAKNGDQWMISGGEWYQNNHPDFLFVPRKGSTAKAYWDYLAEDPQLVGPQASKRSGYPLCKLLKGLVESSAQESVTYDCSVR
jgi:hypothetical protein